jgi:heme-degrading monooxygenase HmoA
MIVLSDTTKSEVAGYSPTGGDPMVTGIFHYKLRADIDMAEYEAEVFHMYELVSGNPAFGLVDLQTFNGPDGDNVLVATFEHAEGIEAWRNDPEHVVTQERGRTEWFESYWGGEIIRHYDFDQATGRRETPERADRFATHRQQTAATADPAL